MTGITVSQADDQLVAVKNAADPEQRALLRHEADLLSRLDHPGVVRFVDFDEGPPTTLRTAFVGPDSWASATPQRAAFAAMAATLADLHDAGIAHGDLTEAHILVDPDTRPILCGFSAAGPATPDRLHADRAALASILRRHVDDNPSPDRHRILEAAEALEQPELPTRAAVRVLDDLAPPTPDTRTRRIWPVRTIAATFLVSSVSLAAYATLRPDSDSAVAIAPVPPATTEAPTPVDFLPIEDLPDDDLASDNRPQATVADPEATTIERNGRRYGVGSPGDIVAVEDWTCDGVATPAVLRPSTGEVAVFASWPGPGESLTPSVTTTVDDAIDFVATKDPCPELRLRTPSGSRLIGVPTS